MSDTYGFVFRDWNIYKDARLFRIHVGTLVKKYPLEERYALADQTKRALSSIILNIAEGANRNTHKDARVYINRSHGSLDEVIACLDCALDSSFISNQEHEAALHMASSLAKRLRAFATHLAS